MCKNQGRHGNASTKITNELLDKSDQTNCNTITNPSETKAKLDKYSENLIYCLQKSHILSTKKE